MSELQNPMYLVEEDEEEETITVNLSGSTLYTTTTESTLTFTGPTDESYLTIQGPITIGKNPHADSIEKTVEPIPTPPTPSFKTEMQDFLLNQMTSKAIASLMNKNRSLDNEVFDLMRGRKMDRLGEMLHDDFSKSIDARQRELRCCFSGANVQYDKIPNWAKTYIKDHIQYMIHNLSLLTEDEG